MVEISTGQSLVYNPNNKLIDWTLLTILKFWPEVPPIRICLLVSLSRLAPTYFIRLSIWSCQRETNRNY